MSQENARCQNVDHCSQEHCTFALGILTGKASVGFLQAFQRCHVCLAKLAHTEKRSASCVRLILFANYVDCAIHKQFIDHFSNDKKDTDKDETIQTMQIWVSK